MSSGEVFKVEISGIFDISAEEIEVHFQKKKYGGGDVTVTNLKDGKAVMIIEGIALESEINAYMDQIMAKIMSLIRNTLQYKNGGVMGGTRGVRHYKPSGTRDHKHGKCQKWAWQGNYKCVIPYR